MAVILVIDDNQDILSATRRVLRKEGFQIKVANDGIEAIAMMASKEEAVDLIICDVDMPEANGIQVYKWIMKELPEMAGKFLFYTSSGEWLEKEGLGSVPRVSKPSHPSTFMKAISTLLAA